MGKACLQLLCAQRTLTAPVSVLLALAIPIHFVFGAILALPVSPADPFLNTYWIEILQLGGPVHWKAKLPAHECPGQ